MRTLGIITARGGSKGIPRKNIKPLCGKPLLCYTAEAALAARRLNRVVLTTDDEEIAEVGRRYGVDVPFLRPKELAQDDTPSLLVVQHAVAFLEERAQRYDVICLLQPTSPLRTSADIDGCIELLEESGADAVVSIVTVPIQFNPHKLYLQDQEGFLHLITGEREPIPRRQDIPPAFRRDGSVYLTRRDVVMKDHSLYGKRVKGFLMNGDRSVDIDGPEDWDTAERMLASESSR
ncbi:MAG TPA: acylneuraminate cytidylyltransferase family protein [Candidatus Binatia bacterium]|nr:acylneuraminate cytidylyltransferase family protein [Candidatus Binatia bacterium]